MELYIFGTGCGAGELIDSGLDPGQLRAFVESAPQPGACFLGRPVISPEELAGRDYDLLLVTSRDVPAIARRCEAAGIDQDRVMYLKNHFTLTDRNLNYEKAASVLPKAALKCCKAHRKSSKTPPGRPANCCLRMPWRVTMSA